MITIKLSKNQFDYLKYLLLDEKQVLFESLKYNYNEQYVIVEVNPDNADEIRDFIGEKQQESGYDENYEVTDEGKLMDELIDAFYVG